MPPESTDATEIIDVMKVAAGQQWELPSLGSTDPLVLRVIETAGEERAVVHTIRRSEPMVILDRSTMHAREIIGAGVLVAGPGALDANGRRKRASLLADLLMYSARRSASSEVAGNVRFDGRELVELVAQDEHVNHDEARAMLRDALAGLGGREITSPYDRHEIGYVIPTAAIPGWA